MDAWADPGTKLNWIANGDAAGLAKVGCLYLPDTRVARAAWQRRQHHSRAYSLCGVTHTLATDRVMDSIGALLTAPVEEWDALICTSQVVRQAVMSLLGEYGDYLELRTGARPRVTLQLPVIPLGIDCAAFADGERRHSDRRRWREELAIGDGEVMLLYMGRLNFNAKAHPLPMLLGLEAAARRTGRSLVLVQAGWFEHPRVEELYRQAAREHCPSVRCLFLDGRLPEVRQGIWAAADIFCVVGGQYSGIVRPDAAGSDGGSIAGGGQRLEWLPGDGAPRAGWFPDSDAAAGTGLG